jgi:hypothetical protein
MDEGQKRAILIAASILVSRKFAQLGPQSSPALESAIFDRSRDGRKDHAENR